MAPRALKCDWSAWKWRRILPKDRISVGALSAHGQEFKRERYYVNRPAKLLRMPSAEPGWAQPYPLNLFESLATIVHVLFAEMLLSLSIIPVDRRQVCSAYDWCNIVIITVRRRHFVCLHKFDVFSRFVIRNSSKFRTIVPKLRKTAASLISWSCFSFSSSSPSTCLMNFDQNYEIIQLCLFY